jgi:DNA-binding transcriptional LysR family regulator
VETDQVDLGLVSYPRSSRTIKATTWREEPMVVVCAPCNRLASQPSISVQDLKGVDVIGFDADLEIRSEIDRALGAHGVEVRVTMEFDNTETIKRAVEIDAGVSLLPEPTIDREVSAGALVARPLAGIDLKRPIGIVQRRGKELGKTARRFMQLLLKQSTVGGVAAGQEFAEDEVTESSSESPEIMDDAESELASDSAAYAARVSS